MFSFFRRHHTVFRKKCGEIFVAKMFVYILKTVISTSYCKITLTNTPDGSFERIVMEGM